MMQLAWLIPIFPLVGFLISGLGRNKLGHSAGWIATAAILASFLLSLGVFFNVLAMPADATPTVLTLFDFISAGNLHIPFAFQLDALSATFLLIITGIGFLIHVYSIAYMGHDDGFGKFFAYLNLFVFSMLLLVMGNNYIIMFIGWEGVGLCSYLLIGFWYKNLSYTYAARKAFVMNRIGDLGFLVGLFLVYAKYGTFNYVELQQAIASSNDTLYLTYIALCFFVGAMGKSAQLPLFTWLPDAMAGPTPVSALIHAATMVTAGIYMISRSHFIYSLTQHAQDVILIIGAATAFIAATIATRQNDIKKVLAYSTVSQLGFMFMALGVGAYTAAVFHVITHAFFKALLFLGSGSVIHAVEGEQDIRHMGGLKKYMKTTYMTFLIGCIAIAGIPPLSGFFSKDEIMMHLFASHGLGQIIWAVAVLAAFMTAYYMFRLLFVTFWGEYRGKGHPHESPALMTVPLMVLALFSVIAGFIGIPEVLGGHHWLASFLGRVITPAGEHAELSHSTEYSLMAFAVVVALSGIGLAYVGFKKYQASAQNTGLASFFENKWYLDELYNTIIVKPIMALSSLLEKFVEKMGIDGLVNGVGKSVQWSSTKVRLMQNGMVGTYLFLLVMGMILLFSLQLIYRLF